MRKIRHRGNTSVRKPGATSTNDLTQGYPYSSSSNSEIGCIVSNGNSPFCFAIANSALDETRYFTPAFSLPEIGSQVFNPNNLIPRNFTPGTISPPLQFCPSYNFAPAQFHSRYNFAPATISTAKQSTGQVSAWQTATLLSISCKLVQPVPAWVDEPVSLVRQSSRGVPQTLQLFLRCPKPVR